ncbi:MAG TPA: alanine racemase [Terriglobales bacterium]|nr:alanine racemase [Terriglobales bacterium]
MAAPKMMLAEFAWSEDYAVRGMEQVLTPALVIYPDLIASNLERMIALLSGDANRWRVHIKTAKLGYTLRMLVERGIRNFKCATTLELIAACDCGAEDVLFAYPSTGANAQRVRELAAQFARVHISVLAENDEQVRQWRGSRAGVFLDINPGMNRTGIREDSIPEIIAVAREVHAAGLEFRGLHYYDGQLGGLSFEERSETAHRGYDRLRRVISALEHAGVAVSELITAGTPSFPCSLSYSGFRGQSFVHRVSPGTIVYNDATSLAQLPAKYGFRPAALVITRVVSRPCAGIATCDAGHKTVSADAGIPTCVVLGHPELTPISPSEEHLPLSVAPGGEGPKPGDILYLLPRHICPTVNNFDCALRVSRGEIEAVEEVSARGREAPLLRSAEKSVARR